MDSAARYDYLICLATSLKSASVPSPLLPPMQGYSVLPHSEELAESAKPEDDSESAHADVATWHYSKPIHTFIYILISINIVLFVANACASATARASLAEVLPTHDPRTLPRPDQYAGLPEASRYKSNLIYLLQVSPMLSSLKQLLFCATRMET